MWYGSLIAAPAPHIVPERTWVVSDTHFGHENIKGYCHRPADVEQIMMEEWARAVPPEDTLLHLGDLCWKGNAWFKNMIARHLTGQKYLILGNHDKGRPSFYRNCGFTVIKPFSIAHNGITVSFSHYPLPGSRVHRDWEPTPKMPASRERIHIHGHIHNNGYGDKDGPFIPYRRNQVNVSAEMMKYKPVNLAVLLHGLLDA